jgi:hypothetical protein
MSGGSHTNFDTQAFTVGAVGGALTLAAAVAAGVQSFREASAESYAAWTAQQLRSGLMLSEARRGHELDMLAQALRAIDERDRRIAQLEKTLLNAARRQPR